MSALPLAPYTMSSTPLPKAATVTSQPQAGKSCFGSWQRKLSRSLALTSCCHGAEKLQEQPHTKDRRALPKGKGFWFVFFFPPPGWTVQIHTPNRANPDCLSGLSTVHTVEFLNTHGVPYPQPPRPHSPPSFLQNVPSAPPNRCWKNHCFRSRPSTFH